MPVVEAVSAVAGAFGAGLEVEGVSAMRCSDVMVGRAFDRTDRIERSDYHGEF